jgi:hypothetical protein
MDTDIFCFRGVIVFFNVFLMCILNTVHELGFK